MGRWQGGTRRGGGRAAHDGAVAYDGGEGKRRGGAACEGAVVVAHDGAGDPLMWVGTRGRGRRQGEGRALVVGGRCILVGLRRHVRGVIGAGASGKQRARAAIDENSTRPRCGVPSARQMWMVGTPPVGRYK